MTHTRRLRRNATPEEIERARLTAEFDREQRLAEETERRERATLLRQERATEKARRREARTAFMIKARPAIPLLLINGGAAYAQAAYAFEDIAPDVWNTPSKVAFSIAFATALESIAVYVQWHAHDALMLKAYSTAASLRRASWLIAGVVAAINYAHFADGFTPNGAAVGFAMLSLISPWLWGLYTRRAQHVQLLAEDSNLIDNSGVEFSPRRKRMFPFRSYMAVRWSIEHNERDPRVAWDGYNAERRLRIAERRAARAYLSADKDKVKAIEPSPAPPAIDPPAPPAIDPPAPPVADDPRPVSPAAPAAPRSAPAAGWDVVKLIHLIQEGDMKEDDMARVIGIGKSTVTRVKRTVRAITADPNVTIGPEFRVPANVVQIIRREVQR